MRSYRLTAAIAALLLAACAPGAADEPLADDLQRDLDMARGTALELAPRGGDQQVVSAIERLKEVPTPARQKVGVAVAGPGPKRLAVRKVSNVGTSAPQPDLTVMVSEPVADTTVKVAGPTPAESPVGSGRPTPVPTTRSAPRGGWKTPSDIIRNAPFPINPLTR
jgi:hypothetical protein